MKKIKKLLTDYEKWADSLDDPMGCAILLPIGIFAFVIVFSLFGTLNYHSKSQCLDSLLPRRYYNFACEERINDEWIKVSPSNEKVYYYNEPASR